jgi:putative ABC transport system ATP-binding protein
MIRNVTHNIEESVINYSVAAHIRLDDVSKVFNPGKVQVSALKNVNLRIGRNEFLAITGPSGSGKSTLLNLIGCLDQPTTGRIEIDGENVADLTPNQLANLRARKLGLIFQSFNLIPVLTVGENVEYPLLLNKRVSSSKDRRGLVLDLLAQLGIDNLINRRPNELSGGQSQRVAVARALIGEPEIVLADEPTSNLDSKTGDSLIRMIRRLHEQRPITFIFSTHDTHLVGLAERIVELHDGEIADEGFV